MIENDKQLEVTIKALNHFKDCQGTFGDDILGKMTEEATQSTIDELQEEIRVYLRDTVIVPLRKSCDKWADFIVRTEMGYVYNAKVWNKTAVFVVPDELGYLGLHPEVKDIMEYMVI